jgi:pimeloyl-ACP methyl ester carboxylesterase
VLAADVKSDWTEADARLAQGSLNATQRIESAREILVDRLARSLPSTLTVHELEHIALRSIEPGAEAGWRFRWDRRVLATEPVDPFAFLSDVRCKVRVMSGSESDVMPPDAAERFAAAISGAEVAVVDGVGHHVELEAPERIAASLGELAALRG